MEAATGGALDDSEIVDDCLADASMDPVDEDDSDDDGNDGEFMVYEKITKGRRANFPKIGAGCAESWSPPTATCNSFEVLTTTTSAPAPPISWAYRPSPALSRMSEESDESVTDIICREIEEAQARWIFSVGECHSG